MCENEWHKTKSLLWFTTLRQGWTNKMVTMTKINDIITKYNDTMLKLLETSLKLKSTFAQGHFSGRNWIVVLMKMNEKCLKNSGKPYILLNMLVFYEDNFSAIYKRLGQWKWNHYQNYWTRLVYFLTKMASFFMDSIGTSYSVQC